MIAPSARKICMLGDFAVGKTSLVARFVHNTFSDKYLTTVGVKVDSKMVPMPDGRTVKVVIWDFAGKNAVDALDRTYLRGAHGLILAVDGTREATFHAALQLRAQAREVVAEVPAVVLLNKVDLTDRWELDVDAVAETRTVLPLFETSAKTGAGVEEAFISLAQQVFS